MNPTDKQLDLIRTKKNELGESEFNAIAARLNLQPDRLTKATASQLIEALIEACHYDLDEIKSRLKLAAHVESDLGPPTTINGKWLFWLCPFQAEKTPSFGVNSDNDTCHCYGCGFDGSVIDYHEKRTGLPTWQVIQDLAAQAGVSPGGNGITQPKPNRRRILPPSEIKLDADPPPVDWQNRGYAAITDILAPALFSPEGDQARAWLEKRGIDEKTMGRFSLGYTQGGDVNGLWFGLGPKPERGIVIPHYYYYADERKGVCQILYGLKVRRPVPPGTPNKYYCASGSKPGSSLFNADSLLRHEIAFVVEGELDCIALHSKIADLAAVITLGHKQAKIADCWLHHLVHIKRFYVATDANEDEAAFEYWKSIVGSRAERTPPPGGCKDVCEAAENGYDLRQWTMETIGVTT